MTKTLVNLIEKARSHQMTEEEKRAQIISFAYGNCAIENPNITREMVECEYDRLHREGK